MILTPLQKLPKNVGDLGKKLLPPALMVAQNANNGQIWSHSSGVR